jgi:hypothetical protein
VILLCATEKPTKHPICQPPPLMPQISKHAKLTPIYLPNFKTREAYAHLLAKFQNARSLRPFTCQISKHAKLTPIYLPNFKTREAYAHLRQHPNLNICSANGRLPDCMLQFKDLFTTAL